MTNLNQQSNDLDQNEKKEVLNQVSDDDLKSAIINHFKWKNEQNEVFINTMLKVVQDIKKESEKYGVVFSKNEQWEIMVKWFYRTFNGQSIETPLGFVLDKKPGQWRMRDAKSNSPSEDYLRLNEKNELKWNQRLEKDNLKIRLLKA